MQSRILSLTFFFIIYLVFLAWYDGWTQSPITEQELLEWSGDIPAGVAAGDVSANLRRMAREDDGKEFFMLNLNRYTYADGEAQQGAPASYQAYGRAVLPLLIKRASHPIYMAAMPDYLITGELKHAPWHEVALVRYRSRRDFLDMVSSDEYLAIVATRQGGIDFAEVTFTHPGLNLASPRLFVLMFIVLVAFVIDRLLKRRINT